MLNEDALKKIIDELPDPDDPDERYGVVTEDIEYITGLTDAYRILRGEKPRGAEQIDYLRRDAAKNRERFKR